jgi:hypothetical protein
MRGLDRKASAVLMGEAGDNSSRSFVRVVAKVRDLVITVGKQDQYKIVPRTPTPPTIDQFK